MDMKDKNKVETERKKRKSLWNYMSVPSLHALKCSSVTQKVTCYVGNSDFEASPCCGV